MKNCIILLIIIVFFSGNATAQQFQMGPRIGPSISLANFGDKDAKDEFSALPKPGFIVGYSISFPLKDNFSFAVDANYSQKGRILRFYEGAWRNNVTYKYFETSMLLRKSFDTRIADNVKGNYFFNIGPNISYLLGGSGNVSTEAVSQPYKIVFNEFPTADFTKMYYNNINRWLFGLDVGTGLFAPITKYQDVLVEFRLLLGHTYFGREDSSSIELLGYKDNMKTNYRTLSITVTYIFEEDIKRSRKGKSTLDKKMKKSR